MVRLTIQQKKNIDMVAPLLLACGVGYFYFQKNKDKDWKMLLAIVLIVFAVGYVITTKITRTIIDQAPPIVLPSDDSLQPCGNFDPKPITDAIHADAYRPLLSVGFRDIDSYKSLAALSNCELVKCYKYWYDNYHSENNESLAQAIAAEGIAFLEVNFKQVQDVLASKFASLNLQ